MKKRLVALGLTVVMLIGLFSIVYAKTYDYPDLTWEEKTKTGKVVLKVHPAAREITQATRIKIMDDYPDGTFKPDDTIRRGEFIKILMSLATNRTFDFASVESEYSQWYGPYVTVAEMQGVIEKNEFTEAELENPITRIEMILMLARTQIIMKNIPLTQVEDKLKYTDIGFLTKEERELVLHAAQYELLEGMKESTDTKLNPHANLTRGEAAIAIMRVY